MRPRCALADDHRSLVAALRSELADASVITDPDVMAAYSRDHAATVPSGIPIAVVAPTTSAEVAHVLAIVSGAATPVVTRGAGSGLSGGANALDGGIILSMHRLNAIIEIDTQNLTVTTQAGVITADLKSAVNAHGLWYPPDPASAEVCSIGGNIATNAGGLCCVKYGVTRDYVLSLEVALADGRLVRLGRRTVKGVAGYDLASLIVGSEGTLGIVTSAMLRLRPQPSPARTLVATFRRARDAGDVIAALAARGIVPSLAEIIDRTTARIVEDWKRLDLDCDAGAHLLLQTDQPEQLASHEIDQMIAVVRSCGALDVYSSSDPNDSDALLMARKLAFPALERLGTCLLDDIAVPRSEVGAMIERIEEISTAHGLVIATFGHAGDGNLHPTILFDPTDEQQRSSTQDAFDAIILAALNLGGTCTGEHGVGGLKVDSLTKEVGIVGAELHHRIKRAFDPVGILNPGRALPFDPGVTPQPS